MKLLVLDRNTQHHKIVCRLFVLDKNTWYHITLSKKTIMKQLHKKCKYKCLMYVIP